MAGQNKDPTGIKVKTPEQLGEFVRNYRERGHLRLEDVSAVGNVGIRFLSEFERGTKPNLSLSKVLKTLHTLGLEVIVRPRRLGEDE